MKERRRAGEKERRPGCGKKREILHKIPNASTLNLTKLPV
jgi:hypothetical protein